MMKTKIEKYERPEPPRQYSWVYYDFETMPEEYHSYYEKFRNKKIIFFGEIPNMPGHCVVMSHITGNMYSGYHTENFREMDEDET